MCKKSSKELGKKLCKERCKKLEKPKKNYTEIGKRVCKKSSKELSRFVFYKSSKEIKSVYAKKGEGSKVSVDEKR